MNLRLVDIEDTIVTHGKIIARAGTKASVRDFSLLHSAVERLKATYGGKNLYPTLFAKTGALLQSLCMNHPFTDGNKRTAWAMTHKFLWLNGYILRSTRFEAADFMVMVDTQKPELKKIAEWIKIRSQKRRTNV